MSYSPILNPHPVSQSGAWSIAVSNFPATQPVSGTVTASLATGANVIGGVTQSGAWNVNISNASLAVTGTFWQATQPVSIAATVNVSIQNASVAVTQSGAWNITTVTTVTSITNPVTVTPPALTKGTQGATGFSMQQLKDAGRTMFAAATVIGGVACVTTEALLSMVPVRAGVAGATATAIQATAGKTLRITAIGFSARSSAAAVLSGRCALRMNPTGAVTATSPVLAIATTTQQAAALAEAGDTCVVPLPDGIEISGTQTIGLTQVCSATTGFVYAWLIGFEY